jgi:hypothetical protein
MVIVYLANKYIVMYTYNGLQSPLLSLAVLANYFVRKM